MKHAETAHFHHVFHMVFHRLRFDWRSFNCIVLLHLLHVGSTARRWRISATDCLSQRIQRLIYTHTHTHGSGSNTHTLSCIFCCYSKYALHLVTYSSTKHLSCVVLVGCFRYVTCEGPATTAFQTATFCGQIYSL